MLVEDSASPSSSPRRLSVKLESRDGEREIRYELGAGVLHEVLPSGLRRRHGFSKGAPALRTTDFFYLGRPRQVARIGGLLGGGGEGSGKGEVQAPMNGVVIKLAAETGDTVEAGQIVMILEAMKMENEVTAPVSGVLEEVAVEAGDTVVPGQSLFRVGEK